MPSFPRTTSFDSTFALLKDPYRFISRTCRQLNSNLFETRLGLRKAVCMLGADAVELFYDTNRITREGATPSRISKTLFGKGGVQSLQGEAHRHRKAMLMSLFTDERISRLTAASDDAWRIASSDWTERESVVIFDEARRVLMHAVCSWAGVPLKSSEFNDRLHDLTAMFDGAGAIGPRYWSARSARRRSDRWMQKLVEQIRSENYVPPADSATSVIAWHRDHNGQLLPARVAAVELLNVLRPTLAVAVFITFGALALYENPEARAELSIRGEECLTWFAQEVRRFYPFFPMLAGKAVSDFDWQGYRFARGTPVMLDLYGTDHDPKCWDRPDEFAPERFASRPVTPFNFVPHGGGDTATGHRCVGEKAGLELMKSAVRFLTNSVDYDVPEQDRSIDFSRVPALPISRIVIANVRSIHPTLQECLSTANRPVTSTP